MLAPIRDEAGLARDVADETILNIPDVAKFRISRGKLIEIDPLPNVSDRNVELYLLGSVVGILLHQRRGMPIHANAIDIGGMAVAFMGHSGAGKSTLAAWFHDRGYAVLADDICPVELVDGVPMAHRGIPRLRLWRDALEMSGREAHSYAMSFDNYEKYDVPTERKATQKSLPLVAIYAISRPTEDLRAPTFERARGVAAADSLMANTYRGAMLKDPERLKDHLLTCLELAQRVPIFMVNRPWGFDRLDGVNRAMESHAKQFGAVWAGAPSEEH